MFEGVYTNLFNILKSKAILIFLTFLATVCVCSIAYSIFWFFNPRYVLISENARDGYKNFKYALFFDSNSTNIDNIKKYKVVKNLLVSQYYKQVDENTLLEGSVSGMANALNDPYTVYFNKDQMNMFKEKTEGNYVGIGISVTLDSKGLLEVVETFSGSPARAAGLMHKDKIIRVGDTDVTDIRDEDLIIKMIKGKENTKVKLTVYRPSEAKPIDFDILRQRIKITNIKSEVLDNELGYIKISMFDSEISSYFNETLQKLLEEGIRGLIIDVRDNPGGDYKQVVKIADRLLPKGTIVYTEDKNGKKDFEYSDDIEVKLPIVVLVNGNSASASEVLAGALKDNNSKGILVGTKTFGKGLVQSIQILPDGSGLKFTVARYFTPSGVCIQGKGIDPDVLIEPKDKYKDILVSQIPREDDVQFRQGIKIILDKLAS